MNSNLGAVTRTEIVPHTHKKKKRNNCRTMISLVHKIRVQGRRGKGTVESFSQEKVRQVPQKEGRNPV